MSRPSRWTTALFSAALAVFGIAQAVYLQAGEETYRELTRDRDAITLPLEGGATWHADGDAIATVHRQTLAYLLDQAPDQARCCDGRYVFDAKERAHLEDVRGVFRGLRVSAILAGIVLLALLVIARGAMLRLLRDGALWAGAATVVIALIAAVAFEPAFLAFHYLFFPQGNFLFDPATSNLLRVYPQSYWYGVTLRVGATFIVVMAVIAAVTWMAMRPRGAR